MIVSNSPIVTLHSREQTISLLLAVVLHYIILSGLLECLEFPIETTGEASVTCMLSFSYEDSINFYSFTAQTAYQPAQALYIDVCEHYSIFILILLQINYSFGLCNS